MTFDEWMLIKDKSYVPTDDSMQLRLLRECWFSRDAEVAELVAALESVEWTRLGEMPDGSRCCYCGALQKHGHVTGCKVANVLKRTTLAQALAKVRKP